MRAIGEAGYILSKSEFCTLAGMTGCKKLIGINVNLPVDEEDLISELEKVKGGLAAKKYLYKSGEGYAIDRNISFLIKACCSPSVFVRLIECREGKGRYRYYYFHKNVIVELDQDTLLEDTFILTPMISADKAIRNMKEFFHIERLSIERISGKLENRTLSKSYSIDHDILKQMMYHDTARLEVETWDMLSEARLDSNLARDMLYALRESSELYSMLLVKMDAEKSFHSSDIYAGKRYLWRVTGSQEQQGKDMISHGTREDMNIAAEQFIDVIKSIAF